MKVYDTFLFFNELDLLEIRLNLLNDSVDYFVISESSVTFSGKPKPLYFLENKERFKKFEHKIIHQVINDTPTDFYNLPKIKEPKNKSDECLNMIYGFIDQSTNFPKDELHWGRDFFQRECLHRALINCNDDDIINFSDIDEIPNPATFAKLLKNFSSKEIYTLVQKEFNYYLNMYKEDGWLGPRVASYSTLKNMSLNKIRTLRANGVAQFTTTTFVQDGGWHFTSLGGTEKIIQKIESWGHQELNTDKIKKNVVKNVEQGKDIFQRRGSRKLKRIEINNQHFPKWLVDNKDSYAHLIHNGEIKKSFIKGLFEKIFS